VKSIAILFLLCGCACCDESEIPRRKLDPVATILGLALAATRRYFRQLKVVKAQEAVYKIRALSES
jgi:hypothetical protein